MSEPIYPDDPLVFSYPKKIREVSYFDLEGSIDDAIKIFTDMKEQGAINIETDFDPYDLIFTRPYTEEEKEEKRKATKLMLDTAKSERYQQYLRLKKEFQG